MVIGALVAPGAMLPVLKEPSFAVAVWVMLSAFRHATVWPAVTVAGFGEKDWVPFSPAIVIVTSAVPPPLHPPGLVTARGAAAAATGRDHGEGGQGHKAQRQLERRVHGV
jgi:hypothetical protein